LFSVDSIHPHNGGYYAIDSLRIEKAYRHWGGELDTTITPWEAGMGFTLDMKKVIPYSFLARTLISHFRLFVTLKFMAYLIMWSFLSEGF